MVLILAAQAPTTARMLVVIESGSAMLDEGLSYVGWTSKEGAGKLFVVIILIALLKLSSVPWCAGQHRAASHKTILYKVRRRRDPTPFDVHGQPFSSDACIWNGVALV